MASGLFCVQLSELDPLSPVNTDTIAFQIEAKKSITFE